MLYVSYSVGKSSAPEPPSSSVAIKDCPDNSGWSACFDSFDWRSWDDWWLFPKPWISFSPGCRLHWIYITEPFIITVLWQTVL